MALVGTARRSARLLAAATAATLALLMLDPGNAAAGVPTTPLTTESFTGTSTADGNWIVPPAQADYTNRACLTAGSATSQAPIPACSSTPADTPGSGALRLTDNAGNQVGSVYNTVSLPGSQGLDITFDTYQYDGSGADGIAFILAATDPSDPHPPAVDGPFGGSLGYSVRRDGSTPQPGVSYGYLGFGLDVYGNYENSTYGGADCSDGAPNRTVPESVTVRGPGNETSGYCVINTATLSSGKLDDAAATGRPEPVPVEIAVNPGSTDAISASGLDVAARSFAVRFTPLDGTVQTVVGSLPDATTLNTLGFPDGWVDSNGVPYQLTFGWAASTGGSNEFHEINQLQTSSLNGQVPVYHLSTSNNEGDHLLVGGTAAITVTPTVDAGQGAEPSTLTVKATLPTGITPGTPTGTGYACTTSGQTVSCSYDPGGTPVAAGTSLPLRIPVTVTAAAPSSATITAKVSSNDSLPATASSSLTVGTFTATAAPTSTAHGSAVTLSADLPAAATGDVTFTHGTTTLCTASAPGYSCSTPALLDAGHYDVTATLDDTGYGKLTATTGFDVTRAGTSFTAAAGASKTAFGTAETLSQAGLPADATGTVSFAAGGTTLCTATLPDSSCTSSATLAPAAYAVTATYGGDGNYTGSTATAAFDVAKAATAITTAATDPTVPYHQTDTLTVGNVPAGATGTVTLASGGATLCTITLPALSCTTPATLAPDSYPVTAAYGGDGNHLGSTATATFTVSKGGTAGLAASATPATAPYGTAVTLGFSGLPAGATGAVTFTAGGTALCTVADVTAASSCVTASGLAVAGYPVTAAYGGDANYRAGTATAAFSITKAGSPSFVASAGAPSVGYGAAETLSFSGLLAGATGTVTFTAGGTTLCTVADVTATSSCRTSGSLAAGSYPVTAAYSGDANHSGETARTAFTVTRAPVHTAARAAANSIADGRTQTLSMTGLPAGATGTVTFSAGGTTLCTARLPATSCAPAELAAGRYDVSAAYSGDANHAGATATTTFTVTAAPRASSTAVAAAGSTATVALHGTSTTWTATISRRPTHGTAEIVDDALVYTPARGFAGTDVVTVRIVRADGRISYQTVHLRVRAAASGPPPAARSAGLADTGAAPARLLLLAGVLLGAGVVVLTVAQLAAGTACPNRNSPAGSYRARARHSRS